MSLVIEFPETFFAYNQRSTFVFYDRLALVANVSKANDIPDTKIFGDLTILTNHFLIYFKQPKLV
jgi:hypothetical protein